MAKPISSRQVEVDDAFAAMEHAWDQGWTDGLPIVPPTPDRVAAFLDYLQVEPDQVIGEYWVRNRGITAEKMAINSVMAGCKAEYMPVVVAALEALTDPEFRLNHIASTSSPWPAFVVNGPIAEEIGLNNGLYVMGPGRRANATIGRAISLTLANCLDARAGGVQQGAMGNPCRMGGMVIAEREDTPWEPLSAMRGFERGTNTVTALSTMEAPVDTRVYQMPHVTTAEGLSAVLAEHLSEGWFCPGTHMVLLSPSYQRPYLEEEWSKADLARYLEEHTRSSVARLKRKGRFPDEQGHVGGVPTVDPGDEDRYVYHAQSQSKTEYLIAVAGGDVGAFAMIFKPYPVGPSPVTKVIRLPGEPA
ncbi:MAG: hypothetical protein IIB12_02805 [Chloroflexi bacterium]|nr:hypothetical protein [Chloroflexota bacterium]